MLTFGKSFSDGRVFTKITSVLQFIIAIVLIVWFGTVFNQVNFVLNSSWGLDKDRVVVIELPVNDTVIGRNIHVEELKNELLSSVSVEDVTVSRTVVGDLFRNRLQFWRKDESHVHAVPKSDGGVDERFIPFYKLDVLAGRNFVGDNPSTESRSSLVGKLHRVWGGNQEAIGKEIRLEKYSWTSLSSEAEVIE
jgi:putative ABC transport system permease protein